MDCPLCKNEMKPVPFMAPEEAWLCYRCPPKPTLEKIKTLLESAVSLTQATFGLNEEEAIAWLGERREALFDRSAVDYIFSGEGQKIMEYLLEFYLEDPRETH